MTTGPTSQCSTCSRFVSPFAGADTSGGPTCAAFPSRIPQEVLFNGVDHRKPVPDDHGVRWESNGQPYPEWALSPTA